MKIRVSARAARDIRRQIDWLEHLSPTAAKAAERALMDGIERLQDHPHSAPRVTARQRQLTISFGHSGFLIRYHVGGKFISINRVLHGRQNR